MKKLIFILFIVAQVTSLFSQDSSPERTSIMSGYIGGAFPIASFSDGEFTSNFNSSTSVVFPIGFNLQKSEKFSFTFELDPVITFTGGSSSVSNLVILPGVLLHQPNVTYGIRAGFETNGRYGLSFSLLKNIISRDGYNVVLGLPIDLRTGNNAANSIGTGLIMVVVI